MLKYIYHVKIELVICYIATQYTINLTLLWLVLYGRCILYCLL